MALVVLGTCAVGLGAQELTTGTIRVVVRDQQGLVVPGATLTVESPRGTLTGVSDQRGRATFPFLQPGEHTARAEVSGFATIEQRGVLVRVNSIAEVVLTVRPADLAETVVVETGPVVNRLSTSIGESLAPETFEALPVSRNFTQVAGLAPGVGDPGKVGENNPSVGGASGLENAYFIDGVNITNTGYGGVGSFSTTFGSLGTNVNFDFIQEVQVKTGGAAAEFGQALGGVINVVTKSGTNQIKGSVFAYVERSGVEGDRKQPNPSLVVPLVEDVGFDRSDVGFAIGGPFVENKLFWFAAFNPTFSTPKRSTPKDFITEAEGGILSPDDFPFASISPVGLDQRIFTYSGKLSYDISSSHRLDVSVFGDPSRLEHGPIRPDALLNPNGDQTGFSELNFGSNNAILRYSGVFENTFAEAMVARAFSKSEESFPPENNQHQVIDLTRGGLVFGGIGQRSDNESENIQAGVKLSHVAGDHQFKVGYKFEDMTFKENFGVVGPTFSVTDASGAVRETFGGARIQRFSDTMYRVIFADLTSAINQADATYHSLFVQDTWTVSDRLTFNFGVRAEREELSGSAGTMSIPWSWAPRVGASFDPTGDGQAKLYAHWGRYYQKVPGTLATRLLSEGTKLTRADYFDADLTQQIPGAVVQTGAAFVATVDEDIKGMYQDEFLGGVEWSPQQDVSLGARFVYRDLNRIVEDVSNVTIPYLFLGHFSDFSFIFTNPGPGAERFLVPDPDNVGFFGEPKRDYKAVELTLKRRPADNWQALASYRWSKLEGNYEGLYGNDYPIANPAANPSFDFPAQVSNPLSEPDPVLGHSFVPGPLATDRRHSVKAYASYTFGAGSVGPTAGLGFAAQSGAPITPFFWNGAYNRADFPAAARGSLGRTSWLWSLDLHADYPIRLSDDVRLRLIVDAFNITNQQAELLVEQRSLNAATVDNPNFLQTLAYQSPRRVRFGVRFDF